MLARVRFPLAVEPNVFWLPALDSNISTVILPFLFLVHRSLDKKKKGSLRRIAVADWILSGTLHRPATTTTLASVVKTATGIRLPIANNNS